MQGMQYKPPYEKNALEDEIGRLLEPKEKLRQEEMEKLLSLAFSRIGDFAYFKTGNEQAINGTKQEIARIYFDPKNMPAARNFEANLILLSNSLEATDNSKIGGIGKTISVFPKYLAACSLSLRLFCMKKYDAASNVACEWAYSSSRFFDNAYKDLSDSDIQGLFGKHKGTVLVPAQVANNMEKILFPFASSNSIKFKPVEGDDRLLESEQIALHKALVQIKQA